VAVPIQDESLKVRYEAKRDHDLAEIHERIQGVGVERAYRITGTLEKLAHHIEEKTIPRLQAYKAHWRKLVLWGDGLLAVLFLIAAVVITGWIGFRDGWTWVRPEWWQGSSGNVAWTLIVILLAAGLFGWLHFRVRRIVAHRVLAQIEKHFTPGLERQRMRQGFIYNTSPWHSLIRQSPVGWGGRNRRRLQHVIAEANRYVQTLNDTFTDPSGEQTPAQRPAPPVVASAAVSNEEAAQKDTVIG
jgi:hypothetical protein